MKMNRRGSSDSLDNGVGDIISSSSSATDFTSDDDLSELYMMSGQPIKNKQNQKATCLRGSLKKSIDDKLLHQHHQIGHHSNNPLNSTRHNVCAAADLPIATTSGHARSLYDDRYGRESAPFYADMGDRLENNAELLFSDHMPEQNLISSENYGLLDVATRQANTSTNPTVRNYTATRRQANAGQSRSGITTSDCSPGYSTSSGYENVGILNDSLGYNGEDDDEASNLFRRPDHRIIDPHILPVIAGPSRQMNHTVAAMCGRLVECRSLGEAIDFVGSNRDIIDNLTRIIREAPAYRNYDISNYQIDYSVKESFNPEFWHDREPVMTTADGNCQYHAVSISLTGSELYTQEVRLMTAMAVIDNSDWFDSVLKIIDGGTVLDLVHTIARSYSWGDATTLKAIAVAIRRRIFLYTCNIGKKDYEMVKSLSREELLDAFKEKKYRGGTGIHTHADPLVFVPPNNYIMLFHKSEHFIAVLPTSQNPIMYEPYNPIVPTFS